MALISGRRKRSVVSRHGRGAFGVFVLAFTWVVIAPAGSGTAVAAGPCGPPVVNPVACENSLPGNTGWQISGSGDASIQGFATTMSLNPGGTVHFKIDTNASAYHLDIYRMGYYAGAGARQVASNITPSVALPQSQPNCLTDPSTGLVDCGNWHESASWAVPSTAVSGIYFALLTRSDTGGRSQIFFVVKNDASHSAIIYQTSDETWQAYNFYGGNSLYSSDGSAPAGRAYKVSYNRPFVTGATVNTPPGITPSGSWVMWAEYPMVRWMERNGYDVSYTTGGDVDQDTGGTLLRNHKVFLSVGHDEYWSASQRANVQAARDAGVSLGFFTGNTMFWKTRWENSFDGSNTTHRTLVTYKETAANAIIDPQDPPTWTGTWRDPRFSPPGDGGQPENALTGQLFGYNNDHIYFPIQVPQRYASSRFWRNTSVATLGAGQTATLANDTLGNEWDVDVDNGFRPAGLIDLSSTTVAANSVLVDYGSNFAPATITHNMTLYRAASGALVFDAGTVQWSWGLDPGDQGSTPDPDMQQATVNLFADMGVQPATLQSGLVAATQSTDTTAPTSTITSPASGASPTNGSTITITGTASDTGGGVVAAVEVSTDGGSTWHRANGTTSWTYSWNVNTGITTSIKSRAIDDSANIETPKPGVTINGHCSCSLFGASTPANPDSGDATSAELGIKFTSDVSGSVTGVRFYKSTANTGTHTGSLWTSTGTLLATATFTNETASGWQQVTFSPAVNVNAGVTYVASYHTSSGHYSADPDSFYGVPLASGLRTIDSPPLHAPSGPAVGNNGLYRVGSGFPGPSDDAANYWVDVMFSASSVPPSAPGAPPSVIASNGNASATVSWSIPADNGSAITSYTVTPFVGSVAQTPTTVTGAPPATSTVISGLTNGTTYTFTVSATNALGTGPPSAPSNAVVPSASGFQCPCTLFGSTVPAIPDSGDAGANVELGVRFTADVSGFVTGVRFYKSAANTGTHTGTLWSSAGALLATATFTGESGSGWQQVSFASPVAVTSGTTYVASYHTSTGHYAAVHNGFATAFDAPPLHAPASGTVGNGVYAYGGSTFPNQSYLASNYSVDVTFTTSGVGASVPAAPTGVLASAGNASANVSWTAPASNGSSITQYTVTPFVGTTAQTPTVVAGAPPATSATVTGLANGTTYTFKVTATNGVGTGVASAASNAVTPSVPPAPPAITSAAQATFVAGAGGTATVTTTGVPVPALSSGALPTGVSFADNGDGTGTLTVGATAVAAVTQFTLTANNGVNPPASQLFTLTVLPPPPAVSAVIPNTGATTGGTAVTLTGTNLTGATAVSFGGAPASFSVNSATSISAVSPAHAVGAVDVTVTTPGGASATGAPDRFTYAKVDQTITFAAPPASSLAQSPVTLSATASSGLAVTFSSTTPTVCTSGGTNGATITLVSVGTCTVQADQAGNGVYNAAPAVLQGFGVTKADQTITLTLPSTATLGMPPVVVSATASSGLVVTFSTTTPSVCTSGGTNGATITLVALGTCTVRADQSGNAVYNTAPTVQQDFTVVAPNQSIAFAALANRTFGDAPFTVAATATSGLAVAFSSTTTSICTATGANGATITIVAAGTCTVEADQAGDTTFTPAIPVQQSFTVAKANQTITFAALANKSTAQSPLVVSATASSGLAVAFSTTTPTVCTSAGTNGATISLVASGTCTVLADQAGNANFNPAVTVPQSFAVSAATYTLFGSTVPAIPDSGDAGANVELGVKFTADAAGFVTAVRFYKSAANTGTHTGSLWSSAGTRLATATFTGESASGWQQVNFSTPVAVSAGTTYIASYHTTTGHYAATHGGFATAVDAPPLHAPASGTTGNGVFVYGASAFPNQSYLQSNYYVDVVYATP